jgi:preprotein translocase subunit YajC
VSPGFVIVIVALFALMWVLLIRPQRRRQGEQIAMQDSLRAGDEIITAGGLHGVVKAIEDDVVHVEIAPRILVRVDRRAIAGVASAEEPEIEEETGEEPDGEPVPPGEG